MTETRAERSPLARLILFMVCLSIARSIVAGAHYYAIDLPDQERSALQQPENARTTKCINCQFVCSYDPHPVACLDQCDLIC